MNKKDTNNSFIKSFIKKLNTDLKVIVLKRHNFEEALSLNLTPLHIIIVLLTVVFVTIILTFTILSVTSLKTYIPGCIDPNIRRDLVNYLIKVDSLEKNVQTNELFLNSISKAMDGSSASSTEVEKKKAPDETEIQSMRNNAMKKLNEPLSKEEVELRKFIEGHEGVKSSKQSYTRRKQTSISDYEFFNPIKGKIIDKYSLAKNQLWVTLEADSNSTVSTILDGIIISIEKAGNNNTIIIQHDNNIISIYKNCKNVLKKVGNYVNTGDVIAEGLIYSNKFNKYAFKFQLWYNGSSINPSEFIKFN